MLLQALADAVVVVHLGFILFVAGGPLLAWRWRRLLWLHVPALVWSLATLTVGLTCPFTVLEKELRRLGGDAPYRGGFVDRYVEGVVYPEEMGGLLRTIAAALVVAGYAGLLRRAFAGRTGTGERSPTGDAGDSGPDRRPALPDEQAPVPPAPAGRPAVVAEVA